MKHYYLFITAEVTLDTSSRFYKVPIGSSKQDVRDYLTLTAIAVDRGYYFAKWDEGTNTFIDKCFDSLWGCHDLLVYSNHLALVSCRDLVRMLKQGVVDSSPQHVLDNASHAMKYLDINYRCSLKRRK